MQSLWHNNFGIIGRRESLEASPDGQSWSRTSRCADYLIQQNHMLIKQSTVYHTNNSKVG